MKYLLIVYSKWLKLGHNVTESPFVHKMFKFPLGFEKEANLAKANEGYEIWHRFMNNVNNAFQDRFFTKGKGITSDKVKSLTPILETLDDSVMGLKLETIPLEN
jgi:hypothetical protein